MSYNLKRYFVFAFAMLACIVAKCAVNDTFKSGGLAFIIVSEDDKTVHLNKFWTEGNFTRDIEYPENVVIPESVTHLGKKYTVTGIVKNALTNGSNIKSLTLPGSIIKIEEGTFSKLTNLSSLSLLAGETDLDITMSGGAFKESSLSTVFIDRNLVQPANNYLDGSPFFNRDITKLEIGEHLTRINAYMFRNCKQLTSVEIPATVTELDKFAFENCSSLKTVTFKGYYDRLPQSFFKDCSSLTDVSCLEHVDVVGLSAFSGCSSIESLVIPGNVKSFEERVFASCSGITSVSILAGETDLDITMSGGAFKESSLSTVFIDRNLVQPATNYTEGSPFFNRDITKLEIGEHLTRINAYMFRNCKQLMSVEIPATVTELGKFAFEGCTSISDVIVYWLEPFAINKNVFADEAYANADLLVPNKTTQIYATTEGWKNFKSLKVYAYTVSVQTTEGGALTVGDKTVTSENPVALVIKAGTNFDVVSEPHEGYELKSLTINEVERLVDVVNNTIAISDLDEDLVINAVYKKITFEITASASDGGTIILAGKTAEEGKTLTLTVEWGDDVEFAVAESEDCLLAAVTVNGTDVTADLKDGKYIINNVREAKNVVATFAQSVLKHLRITDGKKYEQTEAFTTQKLTYKRTFSNTTGWDILVLPASLDYADWKDQLDIASIYDVNVYDENGDGEVDLTEIEAVVMTKGSTLANYPYLVRSKKNGEVIITRGETLVQKPEPLSLECSNTIMKFTITGNYKAIPAATVSANKWYVMKDGVWTAEVNDLGYMRAYLQIEKKAGSYSQTPIPQKISTKIDGSGTGIFGDLNGDGVVNAADHVKLSDIIMKQ